MKKFIKRFYNILLKIVAVFLIIVLVYILYSRYIQKDKVTKIFGYGFLVVLTGSMEPEIQAGELVIIKEGEYEVNDVITYETEDLLVTHRVIEKNGDEYICKGDSNNEKDLKVLENQIQGKVVYHSLSLGTFVRLYLKSFLIIFVIFIIIINFIFSKRNSNHKNKEENNNLERENKNAK